MKNRKFRHWVILFILIMLVIDTVKIIASYRSYRKEIRRQAIERLRLNRRLAVERKRAKDRI